VHVWYVLIICDEAAQCRWTSRDQWAALRGLVIDRHSPRVDRGFPGVDRHRTPSAVDDGESPTIDGGAARVLQVRVAAKLARTRREGTSAVQRGRSKNLSESVIHTWGRLETLKAGRVRAETKTMAYKWASAGVVSRWSAERARFRIRLGRSGKAENAKK
jgi:hypothetical protein